MLQNATAVAATLALLFVAGCGGAQRGGSSGDDRCRRAAAVMAADGGESGARITEAEEARLYHDSCVADAWSDAAIDCLLHPPANVISVTVACEDHFTAAQIARLNQIYEEHVESRE